jgi:hypothetical protein
MEDKRRAQMRIVKGLRKPGAEQKRASPKAKKPLQLVGKKTASSIWSRGGPEVVPEF